MNEQEGLKEWLVSDKDNTDFHLRQIDNPYRSTIAFDEFLQNSGIDRNSQIIRYRLKFAPPFSGACGIYQEVLLPTA